MCAMVRCFDIQMHSYEVYTHMLARYDHYRYHVLEPTADGNVSCMKQL